MRSVVVLGFVLVLLGACTGPRLVPAASTARLPAPVVRRVATPLAHPEAVLPVAAPAAASCDT